MSKKARMNRGLDALFSDNFTPVTAEEKQQEQEQTEETPVGSAPEKAGITTVSISLVEPNKDQPRKEFDDEKLEELSRSIKVNGILQPILVKPLDNGGYSIIAGERRWRAARLAGLKEVPVYIREDMDEKKVMQLALIENVQRENLNPLEEAKAYRLLLDEYGMTQQELSEVLGKSRSAVANTLRMTNLTNGVMDLLINGKISMGHAKVIAGLSDPKMQNDCAQMTVDNNLSVRMLEEYIKITTDKGPLLPPKMYRESLKAKNPFLREFEVSVNDNSGVKVKASMRSKGDVSINLVIGKDMDSKEILSKLAELLAKY